MTKTAIEYKSVSKIYSSSHIGRKAHTIGLKDFDLKIAQGEIFGILGLNGAGKTTSMKLALGLLFPTKGKVLINGLDPSKNNDAKKMIGYQPELAYLNPALNAMQTLDFYARLSRVKKTKDEILAILHLVGLKDKGKIKLSNFSKGMTQRVGLAQALVHNPDVLILDEPVSGLDPLAIHDFRNITQRLNKEGKTIFLSSHSISEMEKLCHRIAILVEGKIKKLIKHSDWSEQGGLEKIFVKTVKTDGAEK